MKFNFIGKFFNFNVCVKKINKTYFRLRMPLKGEMRKKWIENTRKYQKLDDILTYVNICSEHFSSEFILESKKLKTGAVPTIFR